jgi:hypothetical protein
MGGPLEVAAWAAVPQKAAASSSARIRCRLFAKDTDAHRSINRIFHVPRCASLI